MINGVNNIAEQPKKKEKKLFDPASDEAKSSIFEKIKQEMDKGHYSKINQDVLFSAIAKAQNDYMFYDKNKDGILTQKEISELNPYGSKDVNEYMNTKNGVTGKKIYTDTDYASYVLNYYDRYTVYEER